jgi:hypothetical protein
MENTIAYLETLIRETQKSESEVMTKVFQMGLRQLWREHVLGRYLRHEISREEAIESVGIDWVDLAERHKEVMMEDMAWALEN